jgi:hypothetical protein
MRVAADRLSRDDEGRFSLTIRAQQHLISADLTARGFAMRNRNLSEQLLREGSNASHTDGAEVSSTQAVAEPVVTESTADF